MAGDAGEGVLVASSVIISITDKRSKGFATNTWNPALKARSLLPAQDIAMAGVNPPLFGVSWRTRAMRS